MTKTSHLTKLLLSVGLAFAAAVLNWYWISVKSIPPSFVAAKVTLKRGQLLTDEMLVAAPVAGKAEELRKYLIPYGSRAILFGVPATRDFAAGDIFFQRDVQPPEIPRRWDVVGPYRLISVGERFKRPATDEDEYAANRGGNNVTIAVSADFDEKTSRLLEVLNPQPSIGNDNEEPIKIVAVQVVPGDRENGASDGDKLPADENVVYQTVSLEGIANVPRVLLEGDLIRFVVPAPYDY